MKITINSFKAVAAWKWDLPADSDDTCGICRVNFEGTCAKCKYPGDDCPIIIGQCTHCFHIVSLHAHALGFSENVLTLGAPALHQRLDPERG